MSRDESREERSQWSAQGRCLGIGSGQKELVEKGGSWECLREGVRYSKLAKAGASRAFDNQWDCGGAFASLRHGTSEPPLFVEFLVAEQTSSGRHGP